MQPFGSEPDDSDDEYDDAKIKYPDIQSPIEIPIADILWAPTNAPSIRCLEARMIQRKDHNYWLTSRGMKQMSHVIMHNWSRLITTSDGCRVAFPHPRPRKDGMEYIDDIMFHMIKLIQLGCGADEAREIYMQVDMENACKCCKLGTLIERYHDNIVYPEADTDVETDHDIMN